MFYKMIEAKRNEWLASDRCTVKGIIDYIEKTGQMRDAQIEAIKTYLFLKIACASKSLADLFREGAFNTLSLDEIEVSAKVRNYLTATPAAAALFEYTCLKNDAGEQVSPKLEQQIRKDPESIDYNKFFRDAFYGLSYTDYLFSLPMGAGKTYLMAAFIYLDLYFAKNEPNNPAFAHNFIIFAPSGLKSSVVPSLKTIQNFNPAWVIPEPAATEIKRISSFEVLDQSKTAKKSNKTKNPNVQKIANHQPLSELFGLVAVTNAEKVILDRIQESDGQLNFLEESDDEKDRQAIASLFRQKGAGISKLVAYYVAFVNTQDDASQTHKDELINELKGFLEDLCIPYETTTDEDGIFIFPKGAMELDDALVSQPLEWLSDYPQAQKTFVIALRQYSEGIYIRDVADNLRKALETFLQEFLGNNKNLETNKNEICRYLGEQGIDAGISGLFQPLINAYKNINDRIAKHNDAVDKKLLEFLLYQTGVLIRMVIVVKTEECAYEA